MKILIVEDEVKMGACLRKDLTEHWSVRDHGERSGLYNCRLVLRVYRTTIQLLRV